MPTTDFDLLAAWRAGDRGAGRELVERHYDRLYRFFDSKIDQDTEDLITETFLECRNASELPNDVKAVRLLLLRIARHKLYCFLEHNDNVSTSRGFDPSAMTITSMGGGAPTILVEGGHEMLRSALIRIPLESQLIVELMATEHLDRTSLAFVIDVPEASIGDRISRATELLRNELHLPSDANLTAHLGIDIHGLVAT